ncbi:MAG: hypothetical protein Q9160_000937 [Pyrenula sp. 1 TL-2023]
MLQCSLTSTRGAGSLSISPKLTFRSTVPETSPAFALLRPWELMDSDIIKQSQITTAEAYYSPWRQDADSHRFAQEFKDLILSLRDWEVDLNESCQSYGGLLRPLDRIAFWGFLDSHRDEELANAGVELLNAGLEFSDFWWLSRHRVLKYSHHNYTRQLAICVDQYRNADEAIFDADSAIHTDDPINGEDDSEPNRSHDMLRDAIISSTNEIAMCIFEALIDRRRRLAALAIKELGWRAHNILDLNNVLDANAALVCKLLKCKSATVPQSLLVPSKWRTIYHALFKGLRGDDQDTYTVPLRKWADIFYDAGFSVLDCDEHGSNLVAVLAAEVEQPTSFWKEDLAEISGYYLRILDKGVTLDQKNLRATSNAFFVPHTPAALYLGRQMSLRLFARYLNHPPYLLSCGAKIIDSQKRVEVRQLLMHVVNTKTMDDCICACSLGGCCAITAMFRYLPNSSEVTPSSETLDESRLGFALWLVELLNITSEGWSFVVASIVQFLTFQRLKLTHTCCKYNRYTELFDIFDDEDRTEIQEEESEDLAQLSSLVSEFEHTYANQGVLLSKFLNGYWNTRVDEVMTNGNCIMDESEARQIRELGVVLAPADDAKGFDAFE